MYIKLLRPLLHQAVPEGQWTRLWKGTSEASDILFVISSPQCRRGTGGLAVSLLPPPMFSPFRNHIVSIWRSWSVVSTQLWGFCFRMRSVGSCQNLLTLYHNGLHTEQTWASQMEKRISSQPTLNGDVTDAKRQLEPTMVIIILFHNLFHFHFLLTSLLIWCSFCCYFPSVPS